jgi:hypothetical protein
VPKFHPLMMMWVAKFLGLLLTLGSILFVYAAEKKTAPARIPFASIFLALNPCLWVWSGGGMETSLVTFLFAMFLYAEVVRDGDIMSWISMGFIALSRPELPALMLVYMAWRWVKVKTPPWKRPLELFLLVEPFALYMLFRFYYYSELLPNTAYAKAPFRDYLFGLNYIFLGFRQFQYWWFLTPLFVMGLIKRDRPASAQASLLCLVYLLFMIAEGGDWMPASRFFVHIAPLIAWVTANGFDRFASWCQRRGNAKFALVVIPFMLAGIFFTVDVAMNDKQERIAPWPWQRLTWESPVYEHYWKLATWMKQNLPPDTYVATGEAGLIPYVSGVRIVDCMGLMDAYLSRLPGKTHRKFDPHYILFRNPEYILFQGYLSDGNLLTDYWYCRKLWAVRQVRRSYEPVYRVEDLILFRKKPEIPDPLKIPTSPEASSSSPPASSQMPF